MDIVYKRVESKLAHEIANNNRLKIYQEWSGVLDGITSFQFMDNVKEVTNNLLELINNPVVYFAVQEKGDYYYINYLFYHPFDWAEHKLWIFTDWINDKDSHRHDTESVCLKVHKKYGYIDMVTVSHHSHIFAWNTQHEIIIDSHSHAIEPRDKKKLSDDKRYTIYNPQSYELENMFDWSDNKLKEVKNYFKRSKKVSWLDQQFDGILKNTTATGRYRSQGLQHLPGDIINDPEKLFQIAKKCGR